MATMTVILIYASMTIIAELSFTKTEREKHRCYEEEVKNELSCLFSHIGCLKGDN
ncbi:hypothetical protein [Thermaerobacillus caldiproteolyticus]|uniref:Uncharacterized protein n=1 Tax=Thermaerobacillus caldiproteolyticus TaxID=247480 RepID=A0A7V9Z7I4_9BACL|nr:hypothetical protein [Anoxybacillus caldiproteolyticus]MBA2875385.1 hypothetical protein [Anoxybacillus caldiproteolyticus]